jgi:hypothetical protein
MFGESLDARCSSGCAPPKLTMPASVESAPTISAPFGVVHVIGVAGSAGASGEASSVALAPPHAAHTASHCHLTRAIVAVVVSDER